MIDRDRWAHSCLIVGDEILGFVKDELLRKHLPTMFSLIKKRKLGDRRRSDTVVVSTINYVDWRLGAVSFMIPSALSEKSKFWGSGESVVARLKLKGND